MRHPTSLLRTPIRRLAGIVLMLLAGVLVQPAHAQTIGDGSGMRLGVSFGGISTAGVTVEFFDEHRSLDITVGTWSFRDLSLSVVAKQYVGGGAAKPFVGAGFWFVAAVPPGERLGMAAVLRAPVGLDVNVYEDHSLGAALNVNRGLWVRRTDPEDDLPLNKRLVPLPELYYRLGR